jgi:hypothetical protein
MQGRCFSAAVAAAVLIAGSATAGAQTRGAQVESAEQNVKQSQAYERMLCSTASFRAKRVKQECGSISDPQLKQSCVASFDCGNGAAAPNWRQAPPSETIR